MKASTKAYIFQATQTVKYDSGPDVISSAFLKRSHSEKTTLFLMVFLLFGPGFRKLGVRNMCLFNSPSLRKNNLKIERESLTMVSYQ